MAAPAAVGMDIAEKIAKLFAQAESTTFPHEAQSALAMARNLMLKHRVEQAEVDRASGKRREVKIVDRVGLETAVREEWKERLLHLIADNARCKLYFLRRGRKYQFNFMGHEDDAAFAQQSFRAAFALCERESWACATKTYWAGRPRAEGGQQRLSWCQGFVKGLKDRYAEESVKLSASMSLMLVVPEDVLAAHKANIGGGPSLALNTARGAREIAAAHSHGYATGKSFDPSNRSSLTN